MLGAIRVFQSSCCYFGVWARFAVNGARRLRVARSVNQVFVVMLLAPWQRGGCGHGTHFGGQFWIVLHWQLGGAASFVLVSTSGADLGCIALASRWLGKCCNDTQFGHQFWAACAGSLAVRQVLQWLPLREQIFGGNALTRSWRGKCCNGANFRHQFWAALR